MGVSVESVAAKNAFLLGVLITAACATSSSPPTDAGRFDAPGFDVLRLDSTPSPFDAGASDVLTPRPDTGPPGIDAGRPDTGPPIGGLCTSIGSYEATPDPSNPSFCDSAGVEQCRFGSAPDSNVVVTCGEIDATCSLATNCTCSGSTEFAGFIIVIFVDFNTARIRFNTLGDACHFTLTPR